MKIPDKIRIGGVEYQIKMVDSLMCGSVAAYGHIDYEKSVIELATQNVTHQRLCMILLHEMLHGIVFHNTTAGEIKNEEEVVELFAKGLYQVLQDNGGRLFDLKETEDTQ